MVYAPYRSCIVCLLSSGVEHFPRKEKVVGSNPTGGSTSKVPCILHMVRVHGTLLYTLRAVFYAQLLLVSSARYRCLNAVGMRPRTMGSRHYVRGDPDAPEEKLAIRPCFCPASGAVLRTVVLLPLGFSGRYDSCGADSAGAHHLVPVRLCPHRRERPLQLTCRLRVEA